MLDDVLGRLREERLLELQIGFAETPAPTFAEERRAALLARLWREAGLEPERDEVGNVLAFRPGRDGGEDPVFAIGAHIDTVFPLEEDVRVKRPGEWCDACRPPGPVPEGEYHGAGIGDCAAGLAAVTGVVEALQAAGATTASPLLFAGTVGEEAAGNLRGARALFDGPWGERIRAFVTVDVGVRGAVVHETVAVARYRMRFRGPGGHAWDDWGIYSPVHAAALAAARIAEFEPPPGAKVTANVGVIAGGRAINAIPEEAWFDLDMRSVDADQLAAAEAYALEAVRAAHEAHQAGTKGEGSFACEELGRRPGGAIPRDHPFLRAVEAALAAEGQQMRNGPGSLDANIPLSRGIPAVGFPWGGSSRFAHSLRESYRPAGRLADVRALARLALTYRVDG